MRKVEAGVAVLQLCPQLVYAEVVTVDIAVVKKHNPALAELGQPALEIMANGFVGMQTVNVQQIHAAIGKAAEGLIKAHAHQCGKPQVMRVVVLSQAGVDVLTIGARMGVALPGIHRIGTGWQLLRRNGLAKGEVRDARVRTQLHQHIRPGHRHEPGRKWNMARPRCGVGQVMGLHHGCGQQPIVIRGVLAQDIGHWFHVEEVFSLSLPARSSMLRIGIPNRPVATLVDSDLKCTAS
ncbi:hypothetical protein D3C72_1366150 [compost metagenome]